MKKLVAVVALAALTLTLAGCTAAAAPAPTKLNTFEKALLQSDIKTGDCILSVWEQSFKRVSCDTAHSDEVYSVVTFKSGSFKKDSAAIAGAYYYPVSYQSYLGGELPTTSPVKGVLTPTTWSVSAFSFSGQEELWNQGFKKAIFTVRTDKLDKQVGSVKGTLKK